MKYDCIYETDKKFYLVFEPILTINLQDLIKAHHRISKKNTKIIMETLFDAISYLHGRDILHRDINPNNIFFRDKKFSKENIVLGDFGLSITERCLNNKSFVKCGSPGFIAPEIFNITKKKNIYYDKRCDLFSLGITFYYIRFGKFPYDTDADKLDELLEKNRKCEFHLKEFKYLDSKGYLFLSFFF